MGAQPDLTNASLAAVSTPNSSLKRKRTSDRPAGALQSSPPRSSSTSYSKVPGTYNGVCGFETGHEALQEKPKRSRKKKPEGEEKRMRRFRDKPPQSFSDIYSRANSQRFYVLGRTRGGNAQCPEEAVELTGSTGNIYTVNISQQPTCSCPHAEAGNQCKHVLYVMSRVLRARFDLVYQLALLSTELVEIFAGAPPIEVGEDAEKPEDDKNRKPAEGDCPICFMPFEETDGIVYCRATCGNNIHKECFEMWASTKRQNKNGPDKVTCPMCRTPWQGDDEMVKAIRNTGVVGRDGYVNVADQLGISTARGGT
jgi:hypothetical protein